MRVNHQHETNNLASNSGLFGCALSAQNCAPISPEKNAKLHIQTLEKAITQHRQQLNQWTQKVDIALNSWREKKQRLQAWQTLQERQSTAALLAENRLDQKKMDEFAQRAAMRKPE